MGREDKRIEREFSEYIDRMLAGEEIPAGEGMSEELRTTLDFARKMMMLRGTPSPSFQAELKQKLLQKMVAQEIPETARKGRFWDSMAWRTATAAALIVVMVVVGVFWYTGRFTQAPTPATTPTPSPAPAAAPAPTTTPAPAAAPTIPAPTTPAPTPVPAPAEATEPAPTPVPAPAPVPVPTAAPEFIALELSVTMPEQVYMPGETIEVQLTFSNQDTEALVISPSPLAVKILMPSLPGGDADKIVRSFDAGSEEATLEPGETRTYQFSWDQKDAGGEPVKPGWYEIEVARTVRKASQPEVEQSRRGTEARFLIQYPQGTMEKTITVNETRTVTGLPFEWKREDYNIDIAITLERIELTGERAIFSALVTSPNSPATSYDHPQFSGFVHAEYAVDGIIKDARGASMRYLADGVRLSWGDGLERLDPLPSDAKGLTFIITSFGEWEGPWEFYVLLE